jgi:calcineurin-like phosphoesterase family protein
MTVWFTADLHLGHANIIKFCQRPFMNPEEADAARLDPRGKLKLSEETVQRHDDSLIAAINEQVAPQDTLWILGDFCLAGPEQVAAYRDRIHCREVNLVPGNHDRRPGLGVFNRVMEQGRVEVQGQKIFLNHYPMRSWKGSFHGVWHLYGHVHGNLMSEDQRNDWMLVRDVGVDINDYRPLSFEEIAAYMEPRIASFRRRKERFLAGGPGPIT